MVVRAPPPLATNLRLQPNGAFWSAPPRLIGIVHLKPLSATRTSDLRTSCVSSEQYLATSLSLSPDSEALSIGKVKPYPIKSTANADSVIALFEDYGFSRTQIAKIFSTCPGFLAYNPDKSLKPKLDFFFGSGISGDAAKEIITTNPYILCRNLQKVIIPCVNFLNTLFGDDRNAATSFLLHKRPTRIFRCFSETATPANVETLRRHGVPESHIVKLVLFRGTLGYDPKHFSDVAREVKNMGFNPQTINFVYGLRVRAAMTKEKWVSKMELLKKLFGWSDDRQVQALFVKHTGMMTLSEEKLIRCFQVFINRLGWTPDDIAKYPSLMGCSLENRILPRFSVLEILLSEGLVNKTAPSNAFLVSEAEFLARFVEIYEKELPQLMEIYTKNKGLNIDI